MRFFPEVEKGEEQKGEGDTMTRKKEIAGIFRTTKELIFRTRWGGQLKVLTVQSWPPEFGLYGLHRDRREPIPHVPSNLCTLVPTNTSHRNKYTLVFAKTKPVYLSILRCVGLFRWWH